jgi:hypothetical protein
MHLHAAGPAAPFHVLPRAPMRTEFKIGKPAPVSGDEAVGIVVRDRQVTPSEPRAIAFVWGGKLSAAPSLPFGRWKQGLASAA